MSSWVNFRELRSHLSFELVLRHYGVEVKRRGNQHQGFCPLPGHNGKKNSPSFSANLERGIFQCFGCGAKGNILDFAGLMEGTNLRDGVAFRRIALSLQNRFCPSSHPGAKEVQASVGAESAANPTPKSVRLINPPLDFELKGLDYRHPYLKGRGFVEETIDYFGLGFCSKGLLRDRVVIPLHDQKGRLIGYAGRVVNDGAIADDNPRYRFPSKRERDGKTYEFKKSVFLYNGFRLQSPVEKLVVVESFTGVWWLHQKGYRNVVAIMGSDCSERQAGLITSLVVPSGQVWIIPDGDDAGVRCGQSLVLQLSPHRLVRWIKLHENAQSTDLSPEKLKSFLPS